MNHPRRWILNSLTIISTAILLLSLASWARSLFVLEGLLIGRGGTVCEVRHDGGLLYINVVRSKAWALVAPTGLSWNYLDVPYSTFSYGVPRYFGLGYGSTANAWGAISSTIMPHWLFALVGCILPVMWTIKKWKQHRNYGAGMCQGCGYDLQGCAAETTRCPECGKEFERQSNCSSPTVTNSNSRPF